MTLKYQRVIEGNTEDSLSRLAELVAEGSTVLDLGVGTGELGQFLRTRRNCVVDGLERSIEHIDVASPHYRQLEQGDLEEPDALEPFAGKAYDYIVFADVLEHVLDRSGVLARAAALLGPGGELLLSVPNVAYAGVCLALLEGRFDYRPEGILDETHVRFYTRDSLCDFLTTSGYQVLAIDAITKPLHRTEFSRFAPELLPASLQDLLLRREDALVYQYILRVRPGEPGEEAAYTPERGVINRFETRLYWMGRGDLQHTENKVLSGWLSMDEDDAELSWSIEDEVGIEVLRYSPADREGVVHLERFEVSDGDSAIDFSRPGMLTGALCQNLVLTGTDSGYSLLCQSANAWFEVDLRSRFGDTAPVALAIRIRQSWPRSQDYGRLLSQFEDARRQQTRLTDELVEHRAHRRGLAGEIALLKETLSRKERELEALRNASPDILRQLAALPVRVLRRLRHEFGKLRSMLQTTHALDLSAVTNGERIDGGDVIRVTGDSGHLYFETPASLQGKPVLFELEVSSANRLIGPKLYEVIQGELREVRAPIYEDRRAGRFFGTLKVPAELQGLVLAPSRLDTELRIHRFSLRALGPLARTLEDYWHWVWFYRVFGPAWVAERLREEMRIFFENFPRLGKRRSYADWWEKYGRRHFDQLARQRAEIKTFSSTPRISLVMPTYNTEPTLLEAAVHSVLCQNYENWELCIADDCSTSEATRRLISGLPDRDARIRVHMRDENGHISAATNSAVALATGDYVAFMDHDDELTPDALFHVVKAMQGKSPPQLLYSDEDIVDPDGKPLRPHFKPDWNPDYLHSINYFCHLVVIRRSLLDTLGGLRESFEGAQDYDLLLRATAQLQGQSIHHIPRVLYHWRAAEGSTADAIENKDYAVDAGRRALEEQVERLGLEASVELSELGMAYRLRYHLPDPAPSVNIIMPTRDNLAVLSHCVRSVLDRTDYPDYRLTIVDNGSRQADCLAWLERIREEPRVSVLCYDQPFNFSAINNFAAAQSDADVLLLMNDDMEVINGGWLEEMVSQALRPEIGAVGAKLFYASDYIQHGGVILGLGPDGVAGHAFKGFYKHDTGHMGRLRLVQNYSAVTGACLAVQRHLWEAVGGLDEANFAIAFNDVDFCLKLIEAGYRNLWTPYAQLYHFESWSRGYDVGEKRARFERERDRFKQMWRERLQSDPAYNPNLTRHFENFDLAWPPLRPDG